MKTSIRIIIAEDQVFARKSINALIDDTNSEIKIVAEAVNGVELLKHLKVHNPDIILLDLNMPVMDGKETFNILRREYPDIKIIILSQFDEQVLMNDYFLRGAHGYVPKQELAELIGAIKKVYKGGIYKFHKAPKIVEGAAKLKKRLGEITLKPRHKEILILYAQDKTQAEIAKKLGITRFGVGRAEKKIMATLNINSKAELKNAITEFGLKFLGE